MALSLLPQPKSVKTLAGAFDFKEVDTIVLSRKATPEVKRAAELLASEMKLLHHLPYEIKISPSVKDPFGCIITHHTREGIYVPTTLKKPQAYEILAAGHSLTASATDAVGFFSATRTIRELLQDGTRITAMKIQDWPLVLWRAFHLDLKGFTPSPSALKELVDRVALSKFNVLLVEYDDRFPYKCLPEARGPHAFTPESLKEFIADAESHGLSVVPLIQTLGRWDSVLRRAPYRELAEVPEVPQQFCLSHPKAQKIFREMVREMIVAHPHAPYIHLGAEESRQLGQHPLSKPLVQKMGRHGYILDQLGKVMRQVKAAGKHPMLWDDLLRDMPLETLKKLPKDTALVYRAFASNSGQFKPDHLPHLETYRGAGLKVFGGFAIKGADQFFSAVPHIRGRMENVDWWVEAVETHGALAGLVAVARSRFNGYLTPCEPLPALWPAALYAAERIWTGLGSSRESFERRLLAGFYGLRPEATEVAQAHYQAGENRCTEAAEIFSQAKKSARRNRDVLELLELLSALEVLLQHRRNFTEQLGAMLHSLEEGRVDPAVSQEMRVHLPVMTREMERLHRELTRVLIKRFHKDEIEEFLQDRLLLCRRLLDHLQTLLNRNA